MGKVTMTGKIVAETKVKDEKGMAVKVSLTTSRHTAYLAITDLLEEDEKLFKQLTELLRLGKTVKITIKG